MRLLFSRKFGCIEKTRCTYLGLLPNSFDTNFSFSLSLSDHMQPSQLVHVATEYDWWVILRYATFQCQTGIETVNLLMASSSLNCQSISCLIHRCLQDFHPSFSNKTFWVLLIDNFFFFSTIKIHPDGLFMVVLGLSEII